LLGAALEGRSCAVFSSDLRVRIVPTGRATYPGVTVVCGQLATADDDEDAATNPTVIVEVLSPNTEADDRGPKWAHYQRIPSLREYVLVGQDERRIEIFRRDGQRWTYESFGPGDRATLASIDVSVAGDELYRNPLVDRVGG
jgi:Uma2 family endonuclease